MTSPDSSRLDPPEDIIRLRANETVLDQAFHGFYDLPDDPILHDLFHLAPGSEKSKAATETASKLWNEQGKTTLYMMLTHEAIRQRLRFNECHQNPVR